MELRFDWYLRREDFTQGRLIGQILLARTTGSLRIRCPWLPPQARFHLPLFGGASMDCGLREAAYISPTSWIKRLTINPLTSTVAPRFCTWTVSTSLMSD